MHMRLDEPQNAAEFADSARYAVSAECLSPEECPKAGEAVRGKVGLGAHFDGVKNNLVLDDPGAAPASGQVHRRRLGEALGPQAHAAADPEQVRPERESRLTSCSCRRTPGCPSCCAAARRIPPIAGTAPLAQNQWSQVLGTYDGATLRLYVNGVKVKEAASALGTCAVPASRPALIGGDMDAANALAGDLDELIVYNHALSADEIAALYAYQLSWTEDRENINITVDRDNPTAEVLLSGTPYYPNAPVAIPIGTADPTSDVVSARLCKGSSCGSPGAPLHGAGADHGLVSPSSRRPAKGSTS